MIGKINRWKLRDVWKHEARDFTTWLEDNIDALCEPLGLSLSGIEREKRAGTFNVDLTGTEDTSGEIVIIENQLEKSDHDHLGKLITYLSSLEAKIAIWVVAEPRPEHIRAIAWLNESRSASFYLVKVEAIAIDDSPPAPLFTLITGPNEEAIQVGDKKRAISEQHLALVRFWTALLKSASNQTKLHANITPAASNWIGSGAGLPPGLGLNYVTRRKDSNIELYIDLGKDKEEHNIDVFENLYEKREAIESECGSPLSWERLDGRRACRVACRFDDAGYLDEDLWPELHEKMIDGMIKLERAISRQLHSIDL